MPALWLWMAATGQAAQEVSVMPGVAGTPPQTWEFYGGEKMNLWLAPVVGFVIGWSTNRLALKMIFRPRKAVRIGPFVIQGIIYKKRDQIAHNLTEGIHRILPFWLRLPVVSELVKRGVEQNLVEHSAEELEKLLYEVAGKEIKLIEIMGGVIGAVIATVIVVIA